MRRIERKVNHQYLGGEQEANNAQGLTGPGGRVQSSGNLRPGARQIPQYESEARRRRSTGMRFIKYIFEEPAAMELLAPDHAPDARSSGEMRSLEEFLAAPKYYRGYLSGSDLDRSLTGLTSLPEPLWLAPLEAALGPGTWLEPEESAWKAAAGPPCEADGAGAYAAHADLPSWSHESDQRLALPAIRAIVDKGAVVVLAERAHDGLDLVLFANRPLRDAVQASLNHVEGVRRFVIPMRAARGEHRFYFERYDPDLFADYEIGRGI